MDQKVVLITGANRGIGFEVAQELSENGYRIILTARDSEKGQEAAEQLHADFVELDVSSWSSIHQMVRTVKEKYGKIDVLINNADVVSEAHSCIEVSREKVEETVHTNALGPLYITQAFQDHMNPDAQVVMVSGGAGEAGTETDSYAPLYSASNTFLNALTRHLADTFQQKKVFVNAVYQGWVCTGMGNSHTTGSEEESAETVVWLARGGAHQKTGCFFRGKQEISW